MTEPVRYGQLSSEVRAEENLTCRKIVKEVVNFGVNQRQLMMIMYLLSLELEDIEKAQTISSIIRELGGADVFLIDQAEGANNGT